MNVYQNCLSIENTNYLIRFINTEDIDDLLKVYSDEKAIGFFNSDNCDDDDFHYQTKERMKKALDFWLFSYNHKYFVRYSIVDKKTQKVIGTFEAFNRKANDNLNGALLRMDLRSDYEKEKVINELLVLFIPYVKKYFNKIVITKNFTLSIERVKVLKNLGFKESKEFLIGSKEKYSSYTVLE